VIIAAKVLLVLMCFAGGAVYEETEKNAYIIFGVTCGLVAAFL